MKILLTFILAWVKELVANQSANQKASITFLQSQASVTDAQATAFFDGLANYAADLGLINNGNYNQLRKYITDDNGVRAEKFFTAAFSAIVALDTSPPIGRALRQFDRSQFHTTIDADIAAVATFRDAFTSADRVEERAVRRALTVGLQALREEKREHGTARQLRRGLIDARN